MFPRVLLGYLRDYWPPSRGAKRAPTQLPGGPPRIRADAARVFSRMGELPAQAAFADGRLDLFEGGHQVAFEGSAVAGQPVGHPFRGSSSHTRQLTQAGGQAGKGFESQDEAHRP